MTDRWTAPKTGWYLVPSDREPEYLGTEAPEVEEHEGTWTVISFDSIELPEFGDPVPFVFRKIKQTATVMHFEQGDITMSSGPLPPAPEPSITIPWNG